MFTIASEKPDYISPAFARRSRRSRLGLGTSGAPVSERLFGEPHRIHQLGPVPAMRMQRGGDVVRHWGTNAGGYTLEALLRIRPNGRPLPDFEEWEVKAHKVRNFSRPGNALVTLFSAAPTGGFYHDAGPEAFIRRFGYAARGGYPGQLNIYSDHVVGKRNKKTKLALRLVRAWDCLVLELEDGAPAAIWDFGKLAEHWNHKHAFAVYVPYIGGGRCEQTFQYGPNVLVGEGTDFDRFLDMLEAGRISHDPGLSLVGAEGCRTRVRRRVQFRIRVGDLPSLYRRFKWVDVRDAPVAADGAQLIWAGIPRRRAI